jgi:zinc protease
MIEAVVVALLLAGPPETLQSARPQLPVKLRSPDEVLADYVNAIGGEAAWKRHKSVHMKRRLEVKGMQLSGTEERWGAAGDKTLSVTTISGMGSFRQGSDGKVAWSEDPINGLRILEGPEAEEAKTEAAWNGELEMKKLFTKLRAVPPPDPPPAGHKYECLELVPKLAKPAVACFDAESHLRTIQKGSHASPQGEVPYKVTFSDWRQVGGMTLPYAEEMTAGPMTLLMQVTEVKLDEKLDAKVFALPKPVKAARAAAAPKN